MPQVKKEGLREAILAAAFDLFCRKGYTATTMSEVARAAGISVSNVYVYFDSKLLIFYEIYTPWLLNRVVQLKESVNKFPTPRTKLRRIIIGLWGDIPAADHAFVNAMIEALSTAPLGTLKPNDLLRQCETEITALIAEFLPSDRAFVLQGQLLSHILWMAHDGFAVNGRMGDKQDLESIATLMTDLILGRATPEESTAATPVKRSVRRKAPATS